MQQLLRMGRGAVIPLDTKETDQLWILAAGHPIARGEITIQGDRLCITVTEPPTCTNSTPRPKRRRPLDGSHPI